VGTGSWLTLRLRFVQIRGFFHSIRCISGVYDDPQEKGDITHYQALAAALSATIGTGNIAGVATAIAAGGPGAVFWMWITALVGMATKFTCCSLAVQYRDVHEDGSASGGPMYYLEKGFRPAWLLLSGGSNHVVRWGYGLGFLFAFFALLASFGIGNMVQSNSVVGGLRFILPTSISEPSFPFLGMDIHYLNLSVGIVLSILVALVILGGIKRIGRVASKVVPIMCCIYMLGALIVLIGHIQQIPFAFFLIFKHAFTPTAPVAGFAGCALSATIRYGVARGVFSNEAGLGSAPMAHAAAKTNQPIREGYVAMLGPFIDTIVVCTMTALIIIVTGAWESGLNGADLSCLAFRTGLGWGHWIVSLGLIFFAYSTILSWCYYGDRCAEYLFGTWAVIPYRWLYSLAVILGSVGALKVIWTLADIFNGLMALPNLIALLALSGWVKKAMKTYDSSFR